MQKLSDSIQNLLGCFDTPLSRRKFPVTEFMQEAIDLARESEEWFKKLKNAKNER